MGRATMGPGHEHEGAIEALQHVVLLATGGGGLPCRLAVVEQKATRHGRVLLAGARESQHALDFDIPQRIEAVFHAFSPCHSLQVLSARRPAPSKPLRLPQSAKLTA